MRYATYIRAVIRVFCYAAFLLLPLSGLVDHAAAQSTSGPGESPASGQTGTVIPETPPVLRTSPSVSANAVPAIQDEDKTIVDVVHAEISRGIQGTAAWMDSFFGDWRYAAELNESYVRFGYNVLIEEGAPLYRKPDMQVRIILPQLRKKTRLVFSGAPRETRDFSAVTLDQQREQIPSTEERNVSAAVHQTFFESAQQSFIVRAGAKLHDMRPVVLFGPRYRVLFPLDSWNLRFSEDVSWSSNGGWDSQSVIDLERALQRRMFFRASNSWIWKEHINGYVYALSFSVGQVLSHRRALDYEWVNIFNTRPVHVLTEVDLRIRYRMRLWRDWFFLEVAPQYRFPRTTHFKATPGVLFRLDLIFGNYANFL